jgi:hypothetical protein
MNNFQWPRFLNVLRNDFLQQWKKVWIATLALAGLGLIVYLTNVNPRDEARADIYLGLLPLVLFGGGLLFTSTIFADLHHPLQKFHYLTLPCSNLERFLSRYLLSAPLYVLYMLVAFVLFDWVAAGISQLLMGSRATPLLEFQPAELRSMIAQFLLLQALMFLGAIFFRSHVLIKTVLSGTLIVLALAVTALVSVRLFFWSYFVSLFQPAANIPLPLKIPSLGVWVAGIGFTLWVLFLAYQCLREHEVQGEL